MRSQAEGGSAFAITLRVEHLAPYRKITQLYSKSGSKGVLHLGAPPGGVAKLLFEKIEWSAKNDHEWSGNNYHRWVIFIRSKTISAAVEILAASSCDVITGRKARLPPRALRKSRRRTLALFRYMCTMFDKRSATLQISQMQWKRNFTKIVKSS